MPGNFNIGTSVLKRETRSIGEVEQKLLNDGWRRTGSAAGGRVRYYEKSGFNITAVSGPMATVLMPSGPLRGSVFGDEAVTIGSMSTIGGGSTNDGTQTDVRTQNRSGQHT